MEEYVTEEGFGIGVSDKRNILNSHIDDDKLTPATDHVKATTIPSEGTHGIGLVTAEEGILSTEERLLVCETPSSVGSSYVGSEDELNLIDEFSEEASSIADEDITDKDGDSSVDVIEKDKEFHGSSEEGEEEDTGAVSKEPPLSKNELKYQDLPMEPLCIEIPPNVTIVEMGYVKSIVDELLIVQSTARHQVLDTDSILCFEDHAVLGQIFETFGPVKQPLYSVRLKSSNDADKEWVNLKRKVYFVPEHSQFVHIQRIRGCDASNRYDEEVPVERQEYSDDETEANSKRKKHRSEQQYVLIRHFQFFSYHYECFF
jgi:rRNA processing protein Gar1